MTIAKKPTRSTTNTQLADPERAAEAFIAGARGAPEQADARKTPVMIRFDRDLAELVADRAWEVLYIFAPVPIQGATGSPGSPIAIR